MKFFATVCLRRNGYIQMSPNVWLNPVEEKKIYRDKSNMWVYSVKNQVLEEEMYMKDLVSKLVDKKIVEIRGNPTNSIEGLLLLNGAIKISTRIWEFPEKNLRVKYMNSKWEFRKFDNNDLIITCLTRKIRETLKNFGIKE